MLLLLCPGPSHVHEVVSSKESAVQKKNPFLEEVAKKEKTK